MKEMDRGKIEQLQLEEIERWLKMGYQLGYQDGQERRKTIMPKLRAERTPGEVAVSG